MHHALNHDWPDDTTEPTESRLLPAFVWFALLALGWLIFELTAEPVFVALVSCAKFGWNDLLTSLWLRRTDPNKTRGRIHSLFYLAHGFWKITLASSGISYLLLMVDVLQEAPGKLKGPPVELKATFILSVVAFLLSAFITWIAVIRSRWSGSKVYVNATIHQSRRLNLWPPQVSGRNHVNRLVVTALLLWVLAFLQLLVLVLCSVNLPQHPLLAQLFGLFVGVGLPVSSAVFLLIIHDKIKQWLAVASPEECWPELIRTEDVMPKPEFASFKLSPDDHF